MTGTVPATDPRQTILLFDQDGHPVVPTCGPLSSPRTAAVKHARRAPPKAARSVLDGREHGGIISADGRPVPEARAAYTRILTAANSKAQQRLAVGARPERKPRQQHAKA
ncbi:MAG TPA: hypothetical protein VIL94_02425, partial [Acidothermaceae bacterium]